MAHEIKNIILFTIVRILIYIIFNNLTDADPEK